MIFRASSTSDVTDSKPSHQLVNVILLIIEVKIWQTKKCTNGIDVTKTEFYKYPFFTFDFL